MPEVDSFLTYEIPRRHIGFAGPPGVDDTPLFEDDLTQPATLRDIFVLEKRILTVIRAYCSRP